MKPLTVLEMFAGAGGAALGMHRAGLQHVGLVEVDPHACATLRAAGLGPVIEADVRDLDLVEAQMQGRPDVVWSSFPCQPFSTAGKRKAATDDRDGWPWTLAALDKFKPTWFVGENVRGLTMHTKKHPDPRLCPGCYLERVIMPALRARFAWTGVWLLDAADFGVPQHRRRVFIVAGPCPLGEPTRTHGPGRALPWVSMGDALEIECACFATHPEGSAKVSDRRVRELTGRPSPTIGVKYSGALAGQPWAWIERPAPTVTAQEVRGTRGPGQSGGPDRASDALWLSTGRRRLTVAECATLQAFPADWPWQGTVAAKYRQVGNAVPPRLAEVVAESLKEARHV